MSRRPLDRTSLVAGVAFASLGLVLALDFAGAVDLGFDWIVPALLAAIGAMLLAAGLDGSRR